jgi:hypothetical protein
VVAGIGAGLTRPAGGGRVLALRQHPAGRAQPSPGAGHRRAGPAGQRVQPHRGDARRRIRGDDPGHERRGHARLRRGGQHAAGDLAVPGGVVVASLAGQHQVAAAQLPVQADDAAQFRGAGHDDSAPGRGQAVTGPPGGSGSGSARIAAQHARQPAQARLQQRDLRRARALLRAEHGSRPARPEQRGPHVGQAGDAAGRRRPQSRQVRGGEGTERSTAGRELLPRGVEKAGAQGGQRAGPAVGGRRSAEGDHDPPCPGVQRVGDQLSGAGGLRAERIEGGHQRQPAGLGELDVPGPAVPLEPAAGHRASARAGDRYRVPACRRVRRRQHLQRALAAVGQRQAHQLVAGARVTPARGERRRRLGRADAALERVGRDHDPHRRQPASCRAG